MLFISPPGNDSFRSGLIFCCGLLFFSCEIFELRRLIAAKFCTMTECVFDFIIAIRNFEGPARKNFRGQKRAKFGQISDDFKVWRRISPEQINI